MGRCGCEATGEGGNGGGRLATPRGKALSPLGVRINDMRRDELNRKVCSWLWMATCAANASMGHHGRKNYCGNLL